MKKTNYHTHTKRCMHANGTDADYVKAALDAGLDVLGFSDHGPFPDNRFDFRMPYADLDEYLTCIDALRPTVSFPSPERNWKLNTAPTASYLIILFIQRKKAGLSAAGSTLLPG